MYGIVPVFLDPIISWLPSMKFEVSGPYPKIGFSWNFDKLKPHINCLCASMTDIGILKL